MPRSHQLAAIMFTDVVGYTTLMGSDEEKAFDLLTKNRDIQKPLIEEFHGRWIKELGDGVLASFSNVTEAVLCAGRIQKAAEAINELQLRIGIHLGDVVFENNDIFGDGVNIAARLMTQARAGAICVSESVQSNVSNKKGITINFLREEMLKNVKAPIRIYEVLVDDSLFTSSNGTTTNSPQQNTIAEPAGNAPGKSIAVLPFVNMSNDQDQEYFSDGITEEILNSLAHVQDLRVAGRTSSFHFKGKNIDLRKIGTMLNVHTVLEGSVRKQGNKLRITAQLINVENGFHLWSERYDREMDDIFAIQDEIAYAITEKLKVTLLDNERAIINRNPTENKEAYDLYLKGRFYFNKRGAGIIKGLEFFHATLEKDPKFTLAYTGIADAYCILALYCVIPPQQAMPKAREFADKAIQLDPTHIEAYAALAFINTFYDWDWPAAEKRFKWIFEKNPNYAPSHYWYSYYLSFACGRFEESIAEAKKAAEILEPLVAISHHVLATMYINAGQHEEAVKSSLLAIELDANSYPGFRSLGLGYGGLKQFPEAIRAFNRAVEISSRQPLSLVELCWANYLAGNEEEVQKIVDELLMRSKTEYVAATFLSCVSYYSKKYDMAAEYLEKAFEQRDSVLACIKRSPLSEFVRTDPRFHKYIERMNFPG